MYYGIPAARGSIKYAQVLRKKPLFVFHISGLYFLHLKFLIFHPKKWNWAIIKKIISVKPV